MQENTSADERLKALTDKLENGVSDIFQSGQYADYLAAMSKFHHYSFSNSLLIFMQRPDATHVAGYNDWKNVFGRQVKAHEKGIQILAPCFCNKWTQRQKINEQTGLPVQGADGQPVMEWVREQRVRYKVVSVFDISQTEGKELPVLGVSELTGDVMEYDGILEKLKTLSPLPVVFEAFPRDAKGYCSYAEQRIVIQPDMSQQQTVKTLVHEIAHAKLHLPTGTDPAERPSRTAREVEAESVAYVVCQHLGIDTSDYSFAYVAGWSRDQDMTVLKASLERIRATAAELIDGMEEQERTPPRREQKPQHTRRSKRRASNVR